MTGFLRGSRYRRVVREVAEQPNGERRQYTWFRSELPPAAVFSDLVREGDRLDQLAHRQLGRSRQWWRVLEANVQAEARVESPFELLGDSAIHRERVYFTVVPSQEQGAGFSWSRLRALLQNEAGILSLTVDKLSLPSPLESESGAPHGEPEYSVVIEYSAAQLERWGDWLKDWLNLRADLLINVHKAQRLERAGQVIAIPSETVG